VLNLTLGQQIVIIFRLRRPLIVFLSPIGIWSAIAHLILRQVVTFIVFNKVVHFWHEIVFMVLLVLWLSHFSILTLCFCSSTFLRDLVSPSIKADLSFRLVILISWLALPPSTVLLLRFILWMVVFLRKLLLVLWFASFGATWIGLAPHHLTLPELLLNVRDQSLLGAIICIGVHYGIDGLKVVSLAHWGSRLAPAMVRSPIVIATQQVVVRLLISGWKQFASRWLSFLIHLCAACMLAYLIF